MDHLLASARHAVYVYVVAFLGILSAGQLTTTNLSTTHDAVVALAPAALAALAKVAPKAVALVAAAGASTAPTGGAQDVVTP